MDLRDTPDEEQFRERAARMARGSVAGGAATGTADGAARFADDAVREWSRTLYEAGYAGLTWPKEYGGGGKPHSYQAIFLEELARAEAPQHLGVIGLGMAGPTIIAHGTEAQKARYLQRILSADEIWCQGFSEPDAGSDLSAVRTSGAARRRRSSSSTARRCGRPTRTSPTGASSSRAATRLRAARRAHLPDRRHERARGRGAAAPPDHGRGGVQRDLLLRSRGAGRERRSATSAAAGRSR